MKKNNLIEAYIKKVILLENRKKSLDAKIGNDFSFDFVTDRLFKINYKINNISGKAVFNQVEDNKENEFDYPDTNFRYDIEYSYTTPFGTSPILIATEYDIYVKDNGKSLNDLNWTLPQNRALSDAHSILKRILRYHMIEEIGMRPVECRMYISRWSQPERVRMAEGYGFFNGKYHIHPFIQNNVKPLPPEEN